jgi:multimeric flavodoxin WrbA
MTTTVAINGSPQKERGDTAMVLASFLQGMEDAGSTTQIVYPSALKIKPCDCGRMNCWYGKPGECVHRDDMEELLAMLTLADILVLATPVYIPLPGEMQNLINRLCPLLEPLLEFREGRTRARLRPEVKIGKIALVATGGWWERENLDTVVRIVREFSEDASVSFGGAALRPHAFLMKTKDGLTPAGTTVEQAVRQAGRELVERGFIGDKTAEEISVPLISQEALLEMYNRLLARRQDDRS